MGEGAPLTSLTATLAVYKEGILVGGGAGVLSALVSARKERCSERKGKFRGSVASHLNAQKRER